MSPILLFIIFFTYTGVGKIFLQINPAAVAFIDILIAAWEGLTFAIIAPSKKNVRPCRTNIDLEVNSF